MKLNLHRLKPDGIQEDIASFLRVKLNLRWLKPDGIVLDAAIFEFSHSLLNRWSLTFNLISINAVLRSSRHGVMF